jgi:hypothetical protein
MGYLLIYEPFFKVVLFRFYTLKLRGILIMKIAIKQDTFVYILRSKACTEMAHTSLDNS